MKLRYEINIRLQSHLLGYCHLLGATVFDTHLALESDRSIIEVCCKVKDLPEERLEELTQQMSIPRQHEVEQNYWNISGEEAIDDELSIAGLMTDEADISYDGEVLRIHCVRLNDAK